MREEHDSAIHRIEAFSDGVFAIAITLLIIEISVPELGGEKSLQHDLLSRWPQYLAYILSFIIIGIYWANHNSFFRLFATSDHAFLLINVAFLMTVAFLPFPTAVLGNFLREGDERKTAVFFYAIGLLLPATTWAAVWFYALRRGHMVSGLDPKYTTFMSGQYIVSVIVYVLAAASALLNPWIGLAICIGMTGLYLLPPKPPAFARGTAPDD